MLPPDDQTPADFSIPKDSSVDRLIKRPIRRFVYPIYNFFATLYLRSKYQTVEFHADRWLWGQRGNDYERLRRLVNSHIQLRESKILIAGCGTGRDVHSWLRYRPRELVGVDYFNYSMAWNMLHSKFQKDYPASTERFLQRNLSSLDGFQDEEFDAIGSDAVFEHVKNLPQVLNECYRVLKPGGVVYATFGPLWYCWGGDHVSGYDQASNGYAHLLMGRDAYQDYLDGLGAFHHSEHDGRTWINAGLFSYLRPGEYLNIMARSGLERLYVGAIVAPPAVSCLQENPNLKQQLLNVAEELDLVVTGMTVLYGKPLVA